MISWLALFMGVGGVVMGALWFVFPRFWVQMIPDERNDVWSLPRLNGGAAWFRFIRWVSQTWVRRLAVGTFQVSWGIWFILLGLAQR